MERQSAFPFHSRLANESDVCWWTWDDLISTEHLAAASTANAWLIKKTPEATKATASRLSSQSKAKQIAAAQDYAGGYEAEDATFSLARTQTPSS